MSDILGAHTRDRLNFQIFRQDGLHSACAAEEKSNVQPFFLWWCHCQSLAQILVCSVLFGEVQPNIYLEGAFQVSSRVQGELFTDEKAEESKSAISLFKDRFSAIFPQMQAHSPQTEAVIPFWRTSTFCGQNRDAQPLSMGWSHFHINLFSLL